MLNPTTRIAENDLAKDAKCGEGDGSGKNAPKLASKPRDRCIGTCLIGQWPRYPIRDDHELTLKYPPSPPAGCHVSKRKAMLDQRTLDVPVHTPMGNPRHSRTWGRASTASDASLTTEMQSCEFHLPILQDMTARTWLPKGRRPLLLYEENMFRSFWTTYSGKELLYTTSQLCTAFFSPAAVPGS
ncbi:uncharacterized protein K460DRAFT_417369 [Cucurbitaria berberidis CBS 394.84]|uniref:Uncharacterized protein n=1 Tax=Cucurbitaria berberidis CBS 394.84 TaxID=1168544 RepID=A0A9P4L9B3_9PLEO|nr:uncharacterized protein K460DRAFT_417369 [Cucurbitaria berberidis CBS 394.84]KAF1846248.1 hypothetical protein K460DRAFT_417369 [Cucurbitaria berberidis CBS 394.84]